MAAKRTSAKIDLHLIYRLQGLEEEKKCAHIHVCALKSKCLCNVHRRIDLQIEKVIQEVGQDFHLRKLPNIIDALPDFANDSQKSGALHGNKQPSPIYNVL